MPALTPLFAQANAQQGQAVGIIGWSLLLIGAIVVLFLGVMWFRRWLQSSSDDGSNAAAGAGFTLTDLRELHRRGEMTDEEFERARGRMLGSARAMAAAVPDPIGERRRTGSAAAAAGAGQAAEAAPEPAPEARREPRAERADKNAP